MTAGEEPVQIREMDRHGPVRVYSVRIASSYVEQRVAEQLVSFGKSVRLPGFRPGKIPSGVLKERYGARVRSDVVKRLADEFALRPVPEGAMLSTVDLVGGREAGDLELKVTATSLPDRPTVYFSTLTLERLVLEESDPENESRGTLEAEFRRIAERRIRLGMVVAETARRYEIGVSNEEVGNIRQAMPEVARATEPPAQTRSRTLEEKIIAWIVARAQIKERRVTVDELAAL